MNNIDVVYTPWYNLKKTPSMDVGQVGFHNPKMVSHLSVYNVLTLLQHHRHYLNYVTSDYLDMVNHQNLLS